MLKILRSKSRRKFVFTLCWPWLGDAFARSKCSHHGTCFINWIKENFTVLKRKLKLNPKSAWNIEFNIVRCTWCVHYGSIFSSNLHESCLINRIKSFLTDSKQTLKLRPNSGRNIIGLSDVFLFCTKSAATNINQMEISTFPIVPVGSFSLVAVLCSDGESASIQRVPNNRWFCDAVAFRVLYLRMRETRAGFSPAEPA